MVLVTLFLAVTAIMFSKGSGSFFGRGFYLVKSDSFALIKPPSIVTGEKIKPSELSAGDIVIFENAKKTKSIGMVSEVVETGGDDNEPDSQTDNQTENQTENQGGGETFTGETADEQIGAVAISFKITDDTGEVYTVSERDIISKATKTSRFFGVIINFAASSGGALTVAVIPCFLIVMWELLKPLFKKRQLSEEVTAVKKQDEVPTFISVSDESAVPDFIPEKAGKSAAALKAYKETLKATKETANETKAANKAAEDFVKSANSQFPEKPVKSPDLFTSVPEKQTVNPPAPEPEPPSSIKLAQAINMLNSRRSEEKVGDSLQELSAAEKARRVKQAMEELKHKKGE